MAGGLIEFKGTLRKMTIESNLGMLLGGEGLSAELSQKITINDKGRVWFSAYSFKDCNYTKTRKANFSIDKDDVRIFFNYVERYFSRLTDFIPGEDMSTCDVELTNTDGEVYNFKGSCDELWVVDSFNISDMLREITGIPDLYGFDFNARFNIIDRITLDFNRVKKIYPNHNRKSESMDKITWDYKEQIVIDRAEKALKQFVVIGSGCKIAHEYYVDGGIEKFLDKLDGDDIFREMPYTPDNVINNLNDVLMYRLKVEYQNGKDYQVEGIFDKYGLPEDYESFAKSLIGFMGFYNFGFGETLLASNFNRRRRCEGDYIYLSVIFEDNGKSYYYRTEDDSIEEGDFLLVEAGSDNHKAIVKVVKVEYFSEDKLPLSLQRTRTVIRKAVESDFEDVKEDEEL